MPYEVVFKQAQIPLRRHGIDGFRVAPPFHPHRLKRFRSQISVYIYCSSTKSCRKVMFQSYLFVCLCFHRTRWVTPQRARVANPPPPFLPRTCLKLFNFSTRTSLHKDPPPPGHVQTYPLRSVIGILLECFLVYGGVRVHLY